MMPVMNRPMFSQQPQPQQQMAVPKVEEDLASIKALAEVTQGVEETNQQIDKAEDFSGIMNALRGDNKPEEERRMELAALVGKKRC